MKKELARRNFLTKGILALGAAVTLPLINITRGREAKKEESNNEEVKNPIISIKQMGFQWDTADPFLFCVHHEDRFPEGNEFMGPNPSHFKGRHMGEDFILKDGFRMYHGRMVPGFPGHPHRGFETITVVRKGMVDHADSLAAAGRYGDGDVQWMTAGKGVQHSEMFPLLKSDSENQLELFQIWLNLPAAKKMVEPHFKMLWKESIPVLEAKDLNGNTTKIEVIAGKIGNYIAPAPPPDSWAAIPENEVAVWNIKMEANARYELPAASPGINRHLYYYEGNGLTLNEVSVPSYHVAQLLATENLLLQNGNSAASILILQGKPINEPVIQYGPFVMNSKQEINQAFEDYHKTQFGGWPWPRYDQVHPKESGRFAKYADGSIENKS